MRKCFFVLLFAAGFFHVLCLGSAVAQERRGSISGRATDSNHDALVGARVEVQPLGFSTTTDAQGQFTVPDLLPNKYTVAISYVGFKPFTREVTVTSGTVANVDAVLEIATVSQEVIVRGERERGEIEALNRELTADNIVQVLPAEVITSLPNTNIADAVGRLPSVSLERDEGEGKYVQIRGTEPRLTNLTLDGVHVPSPESVRQVKLDAIPADLVDSVEINKTLSPSQEGDAIGGSVNLVTKKATDQPYYSLETLGGYTPVGLGGRLNQVDGTIGKRFGHEKRLGLLIGGSYDYNQRGTDDIEPSPGVNDFGTTAPDIRPVLNSMDVREYKFYRHRYGFVGSGDYKLGQSSLIYLRGLFSNFLDYGEDWLYTPAANSFISPTLSGTDSQADYSQVMRRPAQRIFNFIAGANHSLGKTLIAYEVALGQGRFTGGFYSAHFSGPPNNSGTQFAIDTSKPFVPKFNQLTGPSILDPANYTLGGPNFNFFKTVSMGTENHTLERDLTGSISATRQYALGRHFGAWEVGFKVRDSHKGQTFHEPTFATNPNLANPSLAPLASFASGTANPNPGYYFGNYPLLPFTNFDKILSFFNANPGLFVEATNFEHLITDSNHYTATERVVAGYVQNTITIGRFKVLGGLRIEGTQSSFVGTIANFSTARDSIGDAIFLGDTPATGSPTYTNLLPSVQLQYNFNGSTNIRASYGRGIARPNFSDLPPFQQVEQGRTRVSVGNPNLKPTNANDYDLLFEHYLKSVGIIEVGWFYKDLRNPIFQIQKTLPSNDPSFPSFQQRQPVNGPRAHIQGVEFAWQQRLSFLPGVLSGMGFSANYSHTTSGASFPTFTPDPASGSFPRTDHPALLRQAPNNWNFDATYDKGPLSARMGLTHNDASIFFYNFHPSDPTKPDTTGGITGPNGDVYYYPHTQVDAQVMYRLPHRHDVQVIASILNLTNEVFGFYQGSEQFPIQREYYNRTYSVGLRWTPSSSK